VNKQYCFYKTLEVVY